MAHMLKHKLNNNKISVLKSLVFNETQKTSYREKQDALIGRGLFVQNGQYLQKHCKET